MRSSAVVLVVTLLLNGCFSYVPMNEGTPGRGSRLRVHLAEPQDVRLTEITANNVETIVGEVVQADSSALVLSAFLLTSQSGYEHIGRGETVRIRRENISRTSKNQISVLQTVGLVGVVALLGVVVGVALNNAGGAGDGSPGGGQEQ